MTSGTRSGRPGRTLLAVLLAPGGHSDCLRPGSVPLRGAARIVRGRADAGEAAVHEARPAREDVVRRA